MHLWNVPNRRQCFLEDPIRASRPSIVDSADLGTIDISKSQLHQLLSWPSLDGISLLVLGNKNDMNGALSEEELVKVMELEKIKDRRVACYSVSAKNSVNIDITLKWLSSVETKKKTSK